MSFTNRWLAFFGLASDDATSFLVHGMIACACHDWGKANDGFQDMLEGRGKQLIRHEQLSAVILNDPSIVDWLSSIDGMDQDLILAAVVGHHLKARDVEFGQPQAEVDQLLCMFWDDNDWQTHLGTIGSQIGIRGRPPTGITKLWSYSGRNGFPSLVAAIEGVRERIETFEEELARDDDSTRRRLLWAVRTALIVADAAGSGLYREQVTIKKCIAEWIADAFDEEKRLDDKAICEKVIEPRVNGLKRRKLWNGWNGFQEACGDPDRVPERALLLAPCGSGKTLAAWRWIQARCTERKRGRVIFLYPTRGTATEGFRDYVSSAGPQEAALVHGTADLDLDGIERTLPEEKRIDEARLFALRQWPKRLFSATVDQFLGFLQYGYGPMCHLPLLADSVVVLDEIHSYDRGMFSALMEFLRHFDVPVLCMTATLLEGRRQRLARQHGTSGSWPCCREWSRL